MAIEHAVWQISGGPNRLHECALASESELEDLICADPSILSPNWLLIGRQVLTAYNKYVDLLAIDETGSLIIIELKKDKTPRDVIAQTLDYASWAKSLDAAAIADIFADYTIKYGCGTASLDDAFAGRFKSKLQEDDLNSSHQMVIVATAMDSSTERIVTYINEYNIPLNVMFFRVFRDGDRRYLSRAWFIDPAQTLEQATTKTESEPWNGEFYVSFGHDYGRHWDDARKYGFISAGGGRWYTRTLNQLHKGDRIWVNIPQIGYVGVGIVADGPVRADEFTVLTEQGPATIFNAPTSGQYNREHAENDDMAEFFVRVNWVEAVSLSEAKSEVGFFGNQNTVARPTSAKWPHTVGRLKKLFRIES